MASLRRLKKSPYWIGCYTKADGTRTQRSTKQRDQRKAQALVDRWQEAEKLASEGRLSEAQARRIIGEIYERENTVPLASRSAEDFLRGWAEQRKADSSPKTQASYAQVARDFIVSLGPRASLDISMITKADVAKYRDSVAKRVTKATANNCLKRLRVALGAAVREELSQDNPAAKVTRLHVSHDEGSLRRPFSVEELRQILRHANGEWRGLTLMGLYTGQRLGDLARMTCNSVDLGERELRFVSRKTGRRMAVPVAQPVIDYLTGLEVGDDTNTPIFPNAHTTASKKHGVAVLSQQFHRILVSAGLAEHQGRAETGRGHSAKRRVNELSFHCLRHTATTLLKTSGVSAVVAQDIIGHDSEAVSRNYTHIDAETKRAAIAKLPDITKL